ncbi:hypothetical protein HJB78_22495 [Rhizobium lentis]|uniref:hypothetical protein n=1 Tax=Rhizobium lentis TaxID=1138194 RepID=UPI001C8306BD|nr:hypothetical protein [Rhizobium lentis]MBX5153729.1 hypothetical protein [Rhizobium lentis]
MKIPEKQLTIYRVILVAFIAVGSCISGSVLILFIGWGILCVLGLSVRYGLFRSKETESEKYAFYRFLFFLLMAEYTWNGFRWDPAKSDRESRP